VRELAERESRRGVDGGLRIDRLGGGDLYTTLAADVRAGLGRRPKTLPPKYFYDERGARLFDAICDLPEYYPTRTEQALLGRVAGDVIAMTRPTHLIELGSGASRKTRLLLDALARPPGGACYVPWDVSEEMLRRSAAALRVMYPQLRIQGIVGDYQHHIDRLPGGGRRLVIFLGSTIGNLTPKETQRFLATLGRHLEPRDALLLGLDLVKPVPVLNAAYNDSKGVTAEFNRNVLRVLNRELDGDFDLDRFEHVAFYDPREAQVEMHLRATAFQRVRLRKLPLDVVFAAGETIRTEISRKFTRADAVSMLAAAGCSLKRWFESSDQYFALALGTREPAAVTSDG
jgi:L-histidine N-alpha-methyltransferase